jgi:hypothetical protein
MPTWGERFVASKKTLTGLMSFSKAHALLVTSHDLEEVPRFSLQALRKCKKLEMFRSGRKISVFLPV